MEKSALLNQIDFIDHGFYNKEDSVTAKNPVLMNQVHSVDSLFLTQKPTQPPMSDSLITQTPLLNLTIKTADCAPVLLVDVKNRMIAAVHAGWKGAFQGVLENTVLQMISKGASIETTVAAVGPHLQKKSFEIDRNMYDLFPKTEADFFEQTDDTHFLFDFHAYVIHRLKRIGLKEIDSVLIDTYTDFSYNSYRREPLNPARQFSCIQIKE